MRKSAILIGTCLGIAGLLFASQRIDVTVQVSDNLAEAREGSSARFWQSGGGPRLVAGGNGSFADLAERLSPAVVNIEVKRSASGARGPEEMLEEFFGKPRRERPQRTVPSSGSGFVITADGFIVTNDHVVSEAEEITVLFNDGKKLEAKVVGRDPKTDLALIKIDDVADLAMAPLGDSDVVRVRDWVMAIGNPFGFEHTVTVGILSARGRNLHSGPYDDFLQTDASINPGNSGGPLIDMSGSVVGINTAIRAGAEGLGFAIPINMAKDLLPQLRETGGVTRGWLGVQIQRVTPPLAEEFGLDSARGALVSQVFEDSPAEKAKLKHGDVILSFDGVDIKEFDDLPRQVASTPPGSAVDVLILRDGKEKQLEAVLEKMDSDPIELAENSSSGLGWGFDVQDLSPPIAEQLGLPEDLDGVVITDVEADSAAQEMGLQRGDVILEANRKAVKSVGDLEDLIRDDDDPVLLIRRGDGTLYVPLTR